MLALLLFGPKRLPVLARELGKWVGEFRRASNEFKMQMEEELRISEQEDRQKKIAAMEAAAPVRPELPSEVVDAARADMAAVDAEQGVDPAVLAATTVSESATIETITEPETAKATHEVVDGVRKPLPIAASGEMKIMPPETGLPMGGPRKSALQELLQAVPKAEPESGGALTGTDAAEVTTHVN
ncbi:MAG: twin-arginine translocase TatA/TatE family subunit [Acidobacteria bacterium]|nr:twin-arginine translocase TatA/TatE family subunit [Acidobacteriota bacterium]